MTLAQLVSKQAHVDFELKHMGEEAGTIRAVFSTFDIEDRDGDIIRASAFADQSGKEIPLVWSHDWAMPVGKGTIEVQSDRAVFKGKFFTDTTAGQEAYKSVLNMGNLQQWSMGFLILEATPTDKTVDEKDPWYYGGLDITRAELFEVSPVLVGANPQTRTLAVKDGQNTARRIDKSALGIDMPQPLAEEVVVVEPGKSFSEELDEVLAALDGAVERGESIKALRAKADRTISAENIARLEQLSERLKGLIGATEEIDEEAQRRQKQMALRHRAAQAKRHTFTMGVLSNE